MLKNVHIIEKSSGFVVAQYAIIIEKIDTPDEHYFDEVWGNAAEEGLVEEDNRDNYDIEMVVNRHYILNS